MVLLTSNLGGHFQRYIRVLTYFGPALRNTQRTLVHVTVVESETINNVRVH